MPTPIPELLPRHQVFQYDGVLRAEIEQVLNGPVDELLVNQVTELLRKAPAMDTDKM